MSNTIDIHCDTCKVTYWFGQGYVDKEHDLTIYSPAKLGQFLFKHRGCVLSVTDDYTSDNEVYAHEPTRYDYKKAWDS